jgi:hypothetical protein
VWARRNEITVTKGDAARFGLRRFAGFEAFEVAPWRADALPDCLIGDGRRDVYR